MMVMESSFLTSVIERYYPVTAVKIQAVIESNVLLEKFSPMGALL